MSHWKSFGTTLFVAFCSLSEATGSVYAQCASPAPGTTTTCATEWSGGSAVNLGTLPGFTSSAAIGINNAGQVVGYNDSSAIEWSGGSIIKLGSLPGGSVRSVANGINDAGQVVGYSFIGNGVGWATEWSDGSVINLGGVPGSPSSEAFSINDAGVAVGVSGEYGVATEWSGGSVINLGPGGAIGINNSGQVVGYSSGGHRVERRRSPHPGRAK
jgi:probable HAF family extracellular repeat protein